MGYHCLYIVFVLPFLVWYSWWNNSISNLHFTFPVCLFFNLTLFPFAQAMGVHLPYSFTKQSPKTSYCSWNVSLFKSESILSFSLVVTIPTGPFYSPGLSLRVLQVAFLFEVRVQREANCMAPVWLSSLFSPLFLLIGISSDCNVIMSFLGTFYFPLWGPWLLEQTSPRTFKMYYDVPDKKKL